jgi:O-antigen/teichoic acid export membrane protein
VASSWSTTRLPEFGILVAKREWTNLSKVWRKSAWMSCLITCFGSVAMILGMEVVVHFFPSIANRYGGSAVACFFCVSMIAQSVINSIAFYLRAFKEEPLMLLSLVNAGLSFFLVALFAATWQTGGAAFGYMLATLIILPFAWRTFQIKGQTYRKLHTAFHACDPSSP